MCPRGLTETLWSWNPEKSQVLASPPKLYPFLCWLWGCPRRTLGVPDFSKGPLQSGAPLRSIWMAQVCVLGAEGSQTTAPGGAAGYILNPVLC